jgi:hypothetical protein
MINCFSLRALRASSMSSVLKKMEHGEHRVDTEDMEVTILSFQIYDQFRIKLQGPGNIENFNRNGRVWVSQKKMARLNLPGHH